MFRRATVLNHTDIFGMYRVYEVLFLVYLQKKVDGMGLATSFHQMA